MQTVSRQIQAQNQQLLFPIRQTEDKSRVRLTHNTVQKSIISDAILKPLNAFVSNPDPEDKDIQQTRKILGEVAKDLSADELKDIASEVQYLVNSWLDDFERGIFEGKTLKEILHEKGGQK